MLYWIILVFGLLFISTGCLRNWGAELEAANPPTNEDLLKENHSQMPALDTPTRIPLTPVRRTPVFMNNGLDTPPTRTPFPPTPTMTPTPTNTPVPPGIFSVIFYPPLILQYDVEQWEDTTPYTDPNAIAENRLQSKKLASCRIGVQGSTNFNDPTMFTHDIIRLGNIDYSVMTTTNDQSETIHSFYIDESSLEEYDYRDGFPVLTVRSKPEEWEECRSLAEIVLSTLSLP